MMAPTRSNRIVLQGSVGLRGDNKPQDVMAVQEALNAISPNTRTLLNADGKNGPKTMGMIYDFQKCVVGVSRPDRRIDPGGKSVKKLNDPGSGLIWNRFPAIPIPPLPAGAGSSGKVVRFDTSKMPQTLPGHVPQKSPGKLWLNEQAMSVFMPHLKHREGVVPHFYKCAGGWVTIGVGTLVDSKHDGSNRKRRHEKYVNELMDRYNVRFVKASGVAATRDEVYDDWVRVFNGKKGKNAAARIARTKTVSGQERRLAKAQIEYFAGKGLYKRHPFAVELHGHIQMAIIDTRWNSAGLHPWYKNHLSKMWDLLNPNKDNFDPMSALDIFYDAYDHRGKKHHARYQERVRWRCERFYEGALAMTA